MRQVKRQINSDGSGSVTLCPEEPEDMVSLLSSTLRAHSEEYNSGMLTT